jgi:DNA polymerase III epsilon subunit-like protein
MLITIFDTETTGLPVRGGTLNEQPYIIQFASITYRFDSSTRLFQEVEQYNQLIKPPISIPADSTRITGISDQTVSNSPAFTEVVDQILSIFKKTDLAVAHNLSFDQEIIGYELERLGKNKDFLPATRFDSMEGTRNICKLPTKTGGYKAPKLMELHQFLLNESFQEAHNAIKDVEALGRCVKVLLKEGLYQPKIEQPKKENNNEQIALF